ncbi:unnamed protein product, partial [Brassica rapa subsp. trilocularis]
AGRDDTFSRRRNHHLNNSPNVHQTHRNRTPRNRNQSL